MLAFFLVARYTMTCVEETQAQAPLAQLAEHLTLNQGVQGSNPWRRMKDHRFFCGLFSFHYAAKML